MKNILIIVGSNILSQYSPTFFIRNPFIRISSHCLTGSVRNLTSRPAIARKLSLLHVPLYFYYILKK